MCNLVWQSNWSGTLYVQLSQCVKKTVARSPMATIYMYRHLATFHFLAPFLATASGWLGCAAHGMRDITREPMQPSGELENESEMTSEPSGPFVKQSAVTSHSLTLRLDGDTTQADASSSKNPTTPPSKRRRFNSEWAEGHEWLKHDDENGVMFCERCHCFDTSKHRNQLVEGCASIKLESIWT